MKRITIFFGMMLLLGFAGRLVAQTEKVDTRIDNMSYWMDMARKGLVPFNPTVPIPPAEFKGTQIQINGEKDLIDSPDIAVSNLTNLTESENSVFIDPNNNQYILNSNNSTNWSGGTVSTLYGADYFQSSNGGSSWGGSYQGAGGSNSGDPTTGIDLIGRQYVNFISSASGQGIAYSDDGSSWTTKTVAPNPGSLADKNHMWLDNSSTSSYVGNLYVAWTDFGGTDDTQIKLSRSTDRGSTWSTGMNLSSAVSAGSHNQGVNIQTGPNGEVYVVWTIYDSWPSDETALGFAKSSNGGSSFASASRIISNIRGIRTTGVLKSQRVNSFPSMAVDISIGPNRGYIYIVWTNTGVPGTNTGTNKSVYMIRSTNGGTSWSTPVRVNQGTFADGKESYSPWISCDPETGTLSVIFYDDRNTASTACEAWVAYSTNAGNTWTDFKVSDVSFTPTPISGLASSYMGDYLGITSKGGRVYPCWTDTRGGLFMTYVSPFVIGLNAAFSASSAKVCTGNTVTFTDQSTGSPTSWTWSFPGGTPSSYSGQTPPAITYSTPGTYDATLVVSDGTNNDTETKTALITVANIFADFTGVPTSVIVGNSVTFTDNSICSPTSWSWSFPGGTPSSYSGQTPPAISYATVGTYDVSLTVSKAAGTDTKTKTGYIQVLPPEFIMSNTTINTCTGNFYDPGGASSNYADNLDYTMVFNPGITGNALRFAFTSFSLEAQSSCSYDYLKIYDGTSTSGTLIGTYCGTTSPGTITASITGSFTFVFHSDVNTNSTGWVAAISCVSGIVMNPATFTASPVSTSQINLDWTRNAANNNVMVAWSTTSTFGTPVNGTTYSPGNTIPGGGTVLYTGSSLSCNHTSLASNTTYYYKAFSFDDVHSYSTGVATNASTFCTIISSFPWNEGFENGGTIPTCWTQQQVNSSGLNWTFVTGNGASNPAAAHTGTYDACLKDATTGDNITRLITPTLNLSVIVNPVLTFWHTQAVRSGRQDRLTLYYRTTPTGTWTQLAQYTASITSWTQETISLPNSSSTYYVAFEGNAKYGYGVCVDDVAITGTAPALGVTPSNRSVTNVAGSTTFSVTSNTSWTASSNQGWCTVTASGTGNGTITATYAENTFTTSRVATITVSAPGVSPVTVTVTQAGSPDRILNLGLFLEGLYQGEGTMNPAMDENGVHWGSSIADKITLELHSSSYDNTVYSQSGINLGTNGIATATIPAMYNGSYYLTIKSRNCIETVSAALISFSSSPINYQFDNPSKVYGGNIGQMTDGTWVFFSGDVNQDGIVDGSDLSECGNLAELAASGYLPEDINGDGLVDGTDLSIGGNNAALAIGAVTP